MSVEMVMAIVFGLVVTGVTIFILKNMEQIKYSSNIIDSVSPMVLFYKNSVLIDANKSFFTYFDKYNSVKDFVEKHGSIDAFFEQEEDFIGTLTADGSHWLEHLLKLKNANIKLKIEGREHYFSVKYSPVEKKLAALIFSDITQLVKLQQEIKDLTLLDPQTKIGNRKYCDIKMKHEVATAQRYKHSLSILMFEIDNLVEIQSLHGEVLVRELHGAYVNLILSNLREMDIYCRFHEAKFLIMLPSTDLAGARQVAQKLSVAVSLSQKILPITMSFGVATYTAGDEIALLLAKVERALAKAKAQGTNRIVIG